MRRVFVPVKKMYCCPVELIKWLQCLKTKEQRALCHPGAHTSAISDVFIFQ